MPGLLPEGLTIEAADSDELLAAALAQLDDGADFVKLYLDGPDQDSRGRTAAALVPEPPRWHGAGAPAGRRAPSA